MFRKVSMAAMAAVAFAMMFCGNDFSASQAFAKGGRSGGHRGGRIAHNGRSGRNGRSAHGRSSVRGHRMVHGGRYFRGGVPYFYAYDGYGAAGMPMYGPYVSTYGPFYGGGFYGGGFYGGGFYGGGFYGGGFYGGNGHFRAHSRAVRGGHSRGAHRGHGRR